MVSGLLTLVDIAAKNKVEHLVFGMAHRGRLETLYSVF
jgi:2-oxoglutarate dehydrogenase E1 component